MPNQEIVQFRCTIKKMFNGCPKDNGWFGCFAHIRAQDKDVKLTGITAVNLVKGMQLDVTAFKNTKDDSYETIEFSVVTKTKTGLVSYLSSLPGVSRETAHAIIVAYGENALDVIKADPDKVQTDINLTDKQIAAITKGVNNADETNTLRIFLPELSPQLIKRVRTHFDDPIKIIKDNPYVLHSVPGISFPLADTIALRLGIDPASPFRVNHGLIHVLETESAGHLFINLTDTNQLQVLCNRVEILLHLKFSGIQEFGYRIMALASIENSPIIIDDYNNEKHLYLTEIYNAMKSVVARINIANAQTSKFVQENVSASHQIQLYQTTISFKLTSEQKQAVQNALTNKISIVTGGPGRGKTTVIDCIAKSWHNGLHAKKVKHDVLLLAPTGKAMNKLRNATHMSFETMTIDKLIVSAEKTDTKKWAELNTSSTLIIIDESSMIDVVKAASLLNIMSSCQFCFVGDIDQLPPISSGHFLKSLIESGKITTTYLTIPKRNGGLILANAEKINNNDINLQYDFTEMPFFPQAEDDDDALKFIIDQYIEELEDCPDITQVALLSPMRKGKLGTVSINMAIQDINCPLNPNGLITYDTNHHRETIVTKGYPINSTIYGNGTAYTRFRIGDIVINTQNMNDTMTVTYEDDDFWNKKPNGMQMGVFNGDCGRIIGYVPCDDQHDDHDVIIIQFFDNRFAEFDIVAGEFEHFDLGYALTVHKAQGCEYNTVIYVSPKALVNMVFSGFAVKNLAYTAVTRAKERAVIIGSKESLNACITHNIPPKNSNIAARLT